MEDEQKPKLNELILDKDALINKNIFLKEYSISETSYNDFINTIEEQFFTDKDKDGKKSIKSNDIQATKEQIQKTYEILVNVYNTIQQVKLNEKGEYILDINGNGKILAINKAEYTKLQKDTKKTQEQYKLFINDFEDYTKIEDNCIVIDRTKFTVDIFYARIIGGYNDLSSQAAMELDKYKQRYLKGFLKSKESLEELIQRANPLRVNYYRTYNASEYTRETIKAIKRALRTFEEKTKRETDEKKLLLLNILRVFQLSPDDKYTINRLNNITKPLQFEIKSKSGGGFPRPVYLDILIEWLKKFMSESDYKILTDYINDPTEITLEMLKNISPKYRSQKLQDFEAIATSIKETMNEMVNKITSSFIEIQKSQFQEGSIENEIAKVMELLVDRLTSSLRIAEIPKEQSLELHIKDSINELVDYLTKIIENVKPIIDKQKEGKVTLTQDIIKSMDALTESLNDIIGVINKVSEGEDIEGDIQDSLNMLLQYFTEAIKNISDKDLVTAVSNIQAGIDMIKTTEVSDVLSKFTNELDKLLQSTLAGSIEFLVHLNITETLERLYQYIKKIDSLNPEQEDALKVALELVKETAKKPFNTNTINSLLVNQQDAIAKISNLLQNIEDTLRKANAIPLNTLSATPLNPLFEQEKTDVLTPVVSPEGANQLGENSVSVEETSPAEPPVEEVMPRQEVESYPINIAEEEEKDTALEIEAAAAAEQKAMPERRIAWPSLSPEPEISIATSSLPPISQKEGIERWAEPVLQPDIVNDIQIINTIINKPDGEINDFHEIIKLSVQAPLLGKYIIGAFIIANAMESEQSKDKDMYKLSSPQSKTLFKNKLTPFTNIKNINNEITNFKQKHLGYLQTTITILNSTIFLTGIDKYLKDNLNRIFKIESNTFNFNTTNFTWRQLLENILQDTPFNSIQQRLSSSIGGNILTESLNSMDGGDPEVNLTTQALTPEKIKNIKEQIIEFGKSINNLKENIKNIESKFNAYNEAVPVKRFDNIIASDDEIKVLKTFFSTIYPMIEAYNNIKEKRENDTDKYYQIIGYTGLQLNDSNNFKDIATYIKNTFPVNIRRARPETAALRGPITIAVTSAAAAAEAAAAAPDNEDKKNEAIKSINELIKIKVRENIATFIDQNDTKNLLIPALNKIPGNQENYIADKDTIVNYPDKIIAKNNEFKKTDIYKPEEYLALMEYFKKNGQSLKKEIEMEAEKIKLMIQQNYDKLVTLLKPFESKQWYRQHKEIFNELLEGTQQHKGLIILLNEVVRKVNEDIDTLSSKIQQKAQIVEKMSKEELEKAKLQQKQKEYEAQQKLEKQKAITEEERTKAERARAVAERERQRNIDDSESDQGYSSSGGYNGMRGGAITDPERKNIIDNISTIDAKLDKMIEESKKIEKRITNISDPAVNLALSGDQSIFNALYNKYLESKQRGDIGGETRATEELMESLDANQLMPRTVLAINMRDKIIFIFATLFIRLFSLSVIEFMIEKGAIKNSNFAILGYLGLYTLVFIAFTLLVNLDMYRLRIVFNFINFHANASNVYTYLALLWVFGGVIYYVTYYLNKDAPLLNTTDETKVRLIYRIQVVSLIIWLFLVLMVSII